MRNEAGAIEGRTARRKLSFLTDARLESGRYRSPVKRFDNIIIKSIFF